MKLKLLLSSLLLGTTLFAGQFDVEVNQVQRAQAAKDHLSSADFMLNKAYKKVVSVLDANGKKELKTAQRAWIKFRDASAKVASSRYAGGSIAGLIRLQSLIEITNDRTAQLTKLHLDLTTN